MMMTASGAPVAPRRQVHKSVADRNAIASAKTNARRAGILVELTRHVVEKRPMPSEATLADLNKVAVNTVRDDLRILRARKMIETRNRRFYGNDGWSVEFAVRIGPYDWTPWPTNRVKAPKITARAGTPPEFWNTRREKVTSSHVAPSVVEQAKDTLRRHGVRLVHHLATTERPNRAHEPNTGAPGRALVVVGNLVMPEVEVVALAANARGVPLSAVPQ